jgi:hypothetical protein
VAVTRVSSNGQPSVDVVPNKGSGYDTFKVQYKDRSGHKRTYRTTYKTYGGGESRTLNFGRGTCWVVVNGKYGYRGATSNEAYLRRWASRRHRAGWPRASSGSPIWPTPR